MKSVYLALLYGLIAEGVIWCFASVAYSGTVDTSLIVAAVLGAVALGVFAPRPFMAFCGTTALAAPAISYSMLGYGLLEMGGCFHAISFGVLGVVAYKLAHGFRFVSHPKDSGHDVA